ncbi:MAG: Uncharacterized protein FD123_3341 [Bacteroidetes bacterium]|nr:MAG: Uncharacterized protein FD123_3341 [Bacteroidota bacterium]
MTKLKMVLAVTFVTAGTFAFGQGYVLSPGDSLVDVTPFNDLNHFTIQQNNISGMPIILSWQQVALNIPSGWTAYLCDNGNCFTGFPQSGTMDTVFAGDYGMLSVAIDPINITGTAFVQYAVWDNASPSQKDTLTWTISANGTAGLAQAENAKPFTVFPSVANTHITLRSGRREPVQYFLLDISGKIVSNGSMQLPETRVSVETLPEGIYFISLLDSNRNRFTERIIVKH